MRTPASLAVALLTAGAAASAAPPRIERLEPSAAPAGSSGLSLRVRGRGFRAGSVVLWNGAGQPTVLLSSGVLAARIPAEALASSGTATVRVFTRDPADGGLSREATFAVRASRRPAPRAAEAAAPLRRERKRRWRAFSLASVTVLPNPWRAERHAGRLVVFERLTAGSTVRIFTSTGAAVRTLPAVDGAARWDLMDESGRSVSAGSYLFEVWDRRSRVLGRLAVVR